MKRFLPIIGASLVIAVMSIIATDTPVIGQKGFLHTMFGADSLKTNNLLAASGAVVTVGDDTTDYLKTGALELTISDTNDVRTGLLFMMGDSALAFRTPSGTWQIFLATDK